MKFTGLKSLIYPTDDIAADAAWWKELLGHDPNFEAKEYVGFTVSGYEVGLFADGKMEDGPVTYLGVENVDEAYAELLEKHDCIDHEKPVDVGGGIMMASVRRSNGMIVGIINNPHFKAE